MSIALHLPDEQELQTESAANAADVAAVEEVDEAAAAVEEGDEIEAGEEGEGGEEEGEEEGSETETTADTTEAVSEPVEVAAVEEAATAGTSEASEEKESPAVSSVPHAPLTQATTYSEAAFKRYQRRKEWETRREEARDRYEGTMFEFRKLEAAAKSAKERWKDAEDALFAVIEECPSEEECEYVEGYIAPTAAVTAAASSTPIASPAAVVEESAPAPATPATDPNVWRRVPISELHLENIKGLGAKKIDQITAACPTIGHLEDMRAGFEGLKALDGIGQAKADAIEDAILNWLSKNRDAEVLAGASIVEPEDVRNGTAPTWNLGKPTEADQESEDGDVAADTTEAVAAGETDEASEDVADTAADESTADDDQLAGDLRRFADIEARAHAIYFSEGDFKNVSPDDALNPVIDNGLNWESGEQGYHKGYDLIDCPWLPGKERDDWLRGWMSGKLTNEEGWEGPGSGT